MAETSVTFFPAIWISAFELSALSRSNLILIVKVICNF